VTLGGLSITPPGGGSFFLAFTGWFQRGISTTNVSVAVFIGVSGTPVLETERTTDLDDNIKDTLAITTRLSNISAGTPIHIKWKTSGDTVTANARTFDLIRVTAMPP